MPFSVKSHNNVAKRGVLTTSKNEEPVSLDISGSARFLCLSINHPRINLRKIAYTISTGYYNLYFFEPIFEIIDG
jgi:hypothetical protein